MIRKFNCDSKLSCRRFFEDIKGLRQSILDIVWASENLYQSRGLEVAIVNMKFRLAGESLAESKLPFTV